MIGDGLTTSPYMARMYVSFTEPQMMPMVLPFRPRRCTSDSQITVADLTGVAVQDIQIVKAVYFAIGG